MPRAVLVMYGLCGVLCWLADSCLQVTAQLDGSQVVGAGYVVSTVALRTGLLLLVVGMGVHG